MASKPATQTKALEDVVAKCYRVQALLRSAEKQLEEVTEDVSEKQQELADAFDLLHIARATVSEIGETVDATVSAARAHAGVAASRA